MDLINIRGITDLELITKIRSASDSILMNGGDLNPNWIREHGWVVIPTESGLTDEDEELWSNAIGSLGYSEFFAIITDDEPLSFPCYLVEANKQGIYEMNYECSANDHLLIPEDRGFAILRPFGLYSLITGPKEFVELAAGSSIKKAREAFLEFVSDGSWQEVDRSFLIQVAQRSESVSSGTDLESK